MSMLSVLRNTSQARELGLKDEVIADTIEDFGEEVMKMVMWAISVNTDEQVDEFLALAMQEFFLVAKDKQDLRNHWDRAMDPEDSVDMFLDKDGNIVFKEVK
jgi:hypothetical protein